jgi:hypothetical protein
MALLDEGETDWKVLAIDVNDPLASKLNGKYLHFLFYFFLLRGRSIKNWVDTLMRKVYIL